MPKLKEEQIKAIDHNDGNILISASAGSGKTFVMLERLIRLVSEGKASLNEILAVTFTEAAADEMKEKLKRELKKSVANGNASLARLIPEVATADISTIHAFCGRLIRKYFFIAGVSPDFIVLDANKSLLIKRQSLNDTFKQLYAKKEKWFLGLVDKFSSSRSDDGLKEFILKAYEKFSNDADPQESIKKVLKLYSQDNFESLLAQYKDYLNLRLNRLLEQFKHAQYVVKCHENQTAFDYCQALIDTVQTMIDGDIYLVHQYVDYKRTLSFGKKLSAEEEEQKAIIDVERKNIASIAKEFSNHLTDREQDKKALETLKEDSQYLCQIFALFTENYAKEKLEENALDFSDLEHFVLKILQDEQTRQEIKDKYKYIFIDEYQDVNGVQEQIISSITSNNLFMVGDVKQSIYGFRGCRPEFFSQRLQEMPKMGQTTLQLNHSFRSAEQVIEMVNKIFCYSMTNQRFGEDYTKSKLIAGGVYPPDATGRAQLHALIMPKRTRGEGEKPRVYNILEEINQPVTQNAVSISALVTKIINQELNKTYYDTKSGKYKRVTFGDICILTRNKDNAYVTKLVQGLIRHGVPVVSEVAQNICNFPEIQVLINVLRLVDRFSGDIPLASTLKSPLGKFSDEDLAEIALYYADNFDYKKEKKGRGCFYDAYEFYLKNAQTPLKDRLVKFNDYFSNLRFVADYVGASGVLERVIADSGYLAEVLAERLGEMKFKRVQKFLAETISAGKVLSVKEFLALVDDKDKTFDLSEIAEEDTVRVMTMHASKGLEFPVVIVCGLERNIRVEDDKDICFFDSKYGFAIKLFDTQKRTTAETLLRGIIKEKSREDGVKEELRLFYVATTRATYSLHLTVSGELKSNPPEFIDATCFEHCLPSTIEVTRHDAQDLIEVNQANQVQTVMLGTPDPKATARMQNNFAYLYPHIDDTLLPLKSSVTKQLALDDEQNSLQHYLLDGEDTTDVERGIIAHKLLEHFDFDAKLSVKEQAQKLVLSGVLTQMQIDKINLERIQKVFDSGAFKGVKNAFALREKSFISNVDATLLKECNTEEKVVVQGVIDLLVVTPDGAQIIDYKYSSLTPESLAKKYAKQLRIYANAVQISTGINVTSTTIVNLFTGDVVAI